MALRALIAVASREGAWNKSFIRDPALSRWRRMGMGTQRCPSLCLHMVCCSVVSALLVPGSSPPTRTWDGGGLQGYLGGGPGSSPPDWHCPTNLFPAEPAHDYASNKNNPEIRAGLACPRVEPCCPLHAGGLVSSAASSLAPKLAPGSGRSRPPLAPLGPEPEPAAAQPGLRVSSGQGP